MNIKVIRIILNSIFISAFTLAVILRFWGLASVPPSLYWEEGALGYDAYSLGTTGKDHHGNPWPIVALESFGDWKPTGYVYALIPFVLIGGLNEWMVRLPSAIAGVLTILGVVYLVKAWEPKIKETIIGLSFIERFRIRLKEAFTGMTQEKDINNNIHLFWLLPGVSLAWMPWHILVSRVAFEANLALMFTVWGAVGVSRLITHPADGQPSLKIKRGNMLLSIGDYLYLVGGIVCLVLAMYTYHAARVFVPLLGMLFGLLYLRFWLTQWRLTFIGVGIALIGVVPILWVSQTPVVQQRLAETSAFATVQPVLEANALISSHHESLAGKLFHHRYLQYGTIFWNHYFDHFKPSFWLVSGDSNPRHSLPIMGQVFWTQTLLTIFGLCVAFYKRKNWSWVFLGWLILAPIPAAITVATPHALRSLPMVVPIAVFSGYGMYVLLVESGKWIAESMAKKQKSNEAKKQTTEWKFLSVLNQFLNLHPKPSTLNPANENLNGVLSIFLLLVIIVLSIFEVTRFWHYYLNVYPKKYAQEWQYGYKELMTWLPTVQSEYDSIYISREMGRPSMYYWFYTETDPKEVQAWNQQAQKDQGEYLNFKNIYFGVMPPEGGRQLWIDTKPLKSGYELMKMIPESETRWYVYEKE